MKNSLRSNSARLGHIKRKLKRDEALTGMHLELALDVVSDGNTGDALIDEMSRKLQTGQKLSAYELHLMLDVFLLHARLSSATAIAAILGEQTSGR